MTRHLTVFLAVMVALLSNVAASAATFYVASYGVDSATCAIDAPCRSLPTALTKSGVGDTITCLDSIASGGIIITKSIDIDCRAAGHTLRDSFATLNNNSFFSIIINVAVNQNDPARTVRLRGLSLSGSTNTAGIFIIAAAAVFLEDMVISNNGIQGIFDQRSGGQTKLFITDSIIRNNGGAGIALGSQGPNTNVLDNVRSEYNAYGLAAAAGNNVLVNRSVMSGNSVAGVEADTGAQVVVDNSAISHNNVGVQSNSSVRLSNDDIAFNNLALSGMAGTFGNNRLSGNSAVGTAPMPVGSASQDLGQQ
jgi:hypothetical protein